MSLQVEPLEGKTKSSSLQSISFIPDEIVVTCLARISRVYYPKLSIISKRFKSLLSSTELYAARSHLKSTEHCLYVSLWDRSYEFPKWFMLWDNPNRTLPNSSVSKKNQKTTGQLLVPIPSSNISNSSVVVVGSEIYEIGGLVDGTPSSAVRVLDCRSHTWRDAPGMNVAREDAASCFYNGKIYVLGGCRIFEDAKHKGLEDDEPWAEVFDTKTQTWECLPDPGTEIPKCGLFTLKEIKGKIQFGNYARDVNNIYSYDPKQCKWECCENGSATSFWSECVVENVSYTNRYRSYGPFNCWWYDIKDGIWKEVKGLDSLQEKQSRIGGIIDSESKLVNCGGKLLLIWERRWEHSKNIWCAEIKVEKRDGGEFCGKVEWDDVVLHTIPTSHSLLDCLAVSL